MSSNNNNNSSYLEVSGQEASDILAAALQQMDGIIAGTKFDSSSGSNGFASLTSTPENTLKHRSNVTEARIIKLVDDLKLALELCDNKQQIIRKLPDDVLTAVVAWLQSGKEEASKVRPLFFV
ncbi:liprin-beta-1-like [Ruditapes philippinarum]|uniref:liprin-beta-1-like n=1 Tax=Ruditapes philippinarum TaxID=129788 RepID=UPI00295B0C1D|nr:liprin-beta-1-like [Ruditapes philippinarum]XP_060568991.1 liprin-beta-1-like [Ruditapes philippinarum]XP_060568992.1 liprin-beta-1-like [Ruditapes philippinarum]